MFSIFFPFVVFITKISIEDVSATPSQTTLTFFKKLVVLLIPIIDTIPGCFGTIAERRPPTRWPR